MHMLSLHNRNTVIQKFLDPRDNFILTHLQIEYRNFFYPHKRRYFFGICLTESLQGE